MKFTKMHGIGNDYIYVNCFQEKITDPNELAKFLSDRHFGIGGDGLVLIMGSDKSDFRMRMFNSDGSESEMCGNAIRCVAKYVYDYRLTDKNEITIETLAGEKVLKLFVGENGIDKVRVDMGEPILCSKDIPINIEKEMFVSKSVIVDGKEYKCTGISMGNPHIVLYMNDIKELEIDKIGPKFENHELFPNRINTEFVEVIDKKTLKMRVWERGAGETLACGTGACAVLVSSVLNDLSEREATVKLLGGDLFIEWDKDNNHVYMTGPAVKVFDGIIDI